MSKPVVMMSYKKLKKPLAPQARPIYIAAIGSLAQLVERFVYTEDVGSSSLSRPTIPQILISKTQAASVHGRLSQFLVDSVLHGSRRLPNGAAPV